MNLKYLVTGTGRCGTVYLAKFLTSVGINCGHEAVFDWRGLDYAKARMSDLVDCELSSTSIHQWSNGKHVPIDKWVDTKSLIAESSYMAAPFLQDKILKDVKFIHVVRHPEKVINSFLRHIHYFSAPTPSAIKPKNFYETFMHEVLPELQGAMTASERASLYYVRWNQMIEENLIGKDYLFHRIEDNIEKVFDFIGLEKQDDFFNDKKSNTYKKFTEEPFTIDSLQSSPIKDELIAISEKYDYKLRGKEFLL